MCAAQHVSHLALAELLYAHNDLLVRTVPPSTSSPVTKSVSCWASNSVNTSVMHLFRNNPINTLCLQSLDFLPHITYTYGQSSVKLPVTRSLGHLVTWSYGHSVIRSLNHSVTWSLCHICLEFNMLTDTRTTSGSTGLLRRQQDMNSLKMNFD